MRLKKHCLKGILTPSNVIPAKRSASRDLFIRQVDSGLGGQSGGAASIPIIQNPVFVEKIIRPRILLCDSGVTVEQRVNIYSPDLSQGFTPSWF